MPLRPLDQFDYHHVLEETRGVALVVFTAPACGACKRLKRVLGAQAERFAHLHLFEVDAGRDLALTRELEVFHLPAMFLYRDGEYHCRLESEPLAERLLGAVDAALQRPPQEAP